MSWHSFVPAYSVTIFLIFVFNNLFSEIARSMQCPTQYKRILAQHGIKL